ncbi:uncharacterized protein SPPG_03298 [Spizellomyces punctatus DAOM BR117]|uniref:Glutamine amidotransferase type-2 domain-containing protein n=1 Tax=Spizellomyces punctatus (strain DAOM BR117) TaxID=645134 RepID=A0A0L0HKD5_SPIPD|nr:uncharacterized protein SPPG_03298 [Spizellomyces punctatus DAOM BR117]KND01498.1 hypothetical protein SPPG_03298 [Spizellomyces punctatus DAOM BR117]|eukprot:XP_016609537.1 hypothetical protein SPPG_03298 [Spizellomyces punctatus DAOM BR117]
MCGIVFCLSSGEIPGQALPQWEALHHCNARRGPNAHASHSWTLEPGFHAELHGWTLHLRGKEPVPQPIVDKQGNVLCFNGEVFGGLEVAPDENDTEAFSRMLLTAVESSATVHDTERRLLACISAVRGPWAMVYWQATTKRLYFGRDVLGRRSLLWQWRSNTEEQTLLLASVAALDDVLASNDLDSSWEEVPADGLYCLQLKDLATQKPIRHTLTRHPWQYDTTLSAQTSPHAVPDLAPLVAPFGRLNLRLPESPEIACLNQHDGAGLSLPPLKLFPRMDEAVDTLEQVLAEAVRLRVENIPTTNSIQDARLAILFSGGLDCICLAALADRYLPNGEPCDLLNLAFENPRIQRAKGKSRPSGKRGLSIEVALSEAHDSSIYNVPDRRTGRSGVAELTKLFPNRPWRFVEIDVPYAEAVAARQRVMELMKPLDTVMDLSIAIAFWFGARGVGHIANPGEQRQPYISKAKVLFSGLGADEQLAGYSRHRAAFEAKGWAGLVDEVQLDVERIANRNLGRDDRIISDHGKEVRFPYLAEEVLACLSAMPIHLKADPRLPRGVGEKLLLRQLSLTRFGLDRASTEPKRAVQFGARSAKMDIGSGGLRGQERIDPT